MAFPGFFNVVRRCCVDGDCHGLKRSHDDGSCRRGFRGPASAAARLMELLTKIVQNNHGVLYIPAAVASRFLGHAVFDD